MAEIISHQWLRDGLFLCWNQASEKIYAYKANLQQLKLELTESLLSVDEDVG